MSFVDEVLKFRSSDMEKNHKFCPQGSEKIANFADQAWKNREICRSNTKNRTFLCSGKKKSSVLLITKKLRIKIIGCGKIACFLVYCTKKVRISLIRNVKITNFVDQGRKKIACFLGLSRV